MRTGVCRHLAGRRHRTCAIGPYVSALAISPAYDVDGTVFVKTEGDEGAATAGRLYRSTVAGDSWQAIGEHDACDPNRLHTPVDELVFSPAYEDDRTLFATTGCGLSRSTDGGDNWRIIAFESIAACSSKDNPVFSTLAVSPTFESDRTLFAGIWAGGLCRSQDGGETWQTIGLPTPVLTPPDVVVGPAAVSALAISPTFATDKTLFAALTALTGHSIDIYRSIDAGDTWQAVAETGESLWFGSVALSPVFESDNTLFWTTSDELHRSTDAGGAWHLVFEGPSRGQLSTVAFSPAFESDNTMFRTEPDKLYRSTDAGDTWRQVTSRDGIGTALVVSPGFESDNTLFMGSGDGVYRSDDAGDTWKPVNRGISHTWMIDLALQMGILLILLQIVDLVVTRYVTGRRVATWAWKALWSVAPLGVGGILIGMASMYNATGLVILGVLVFAIVGAGFAVSRRAGESRQQTAGD